MKAGWKTVKLGELARIISGRNQREVESPNGPHPIIGSGGEMGRAHETLCPAETTVVGRKGSINRPFFMTEAFWNVDTAFGISADKNVVTPKFLHYFCLSFDFTTLNKGTTIPSLVKSDIAEIEIPLPPLAEQKRIVALLDEAFAGIDEAKAKADLNLSSSKIIIGLHLKSIFNQGGCAANEGWHKTKLLNLADVQSGSAFPTERQGKVPNGIPFYKVSDMNISGNERYMINENNSVTEDVRRILSASIFPKGSIIFPKVGGAIATNKKRITSRACCVDNNVMGAIPKPGKMTSEFLYYFFLAYNLSEFANEAHLPSIKKTTVEEWELSVPRNTKDQKCIVEELDILTDNTHKLTQITERKIAALVELKSSLLTQAFAGELTA
jgi:type I restriction enzyme S subunit